VGTVKKLGVFVSLLRWYTGNMGVGAIEANNRGKASTVSESLEHDVDEGMVACGSRLKETAFGSDLIFEMNVLVTSSERFRCVMTRKTAQREDEQQSISALNERLQRDIYSQKPLECSSARLFNLPHPGFNPPPHPVNPPRPSFTLGKVKNQAAFQPQSQPGNRPGNNPAVEHVLQREN
jgi:hypothetical protein